jgi:outer membrane cobalamin receptor
MPRRFLAAAILLYPYTTLLAQSLFDSNRTIRDNVWDHQRFLAQNEATPPLPEQPVTEIRPSDTNPSSEGLLDAEVKPAAPPKPAPRAGKAVERMEVTGTHIKRIDIEGPSPVTTIELEQIKESGAESVGDLLRDQTLNSFGSRREKGGGNFWSESNVDLRGLGQARTLVLLNGKRLPRGGNWSVDLNIIPVAAVERIEILRDGGGAIYGTDALGGVVNIITRKDYEGTAATFKALLPQDPGGESRTYSVFQGLRLDKTQMSFMGNFRDSESLHWNQRTEVYKYR